MLGKKSGLTYCQVRERYEHFRARCTLDLEKYKLKELLKSKVNIEKQKRRKRVVRIHYMEKNQSVLLE